MILGLLILLVVCSLGVNCPCVKKRFPQIARIEPLKVFEAIWVDNRTIVHILRIFAVKTIGCCEVLIIRGSRYLR